MQEISPLYLEEDSKKQNYEWVINSEEISEKKNLNKFLEVLQHLNISVAPEFQTDHELSNPNNAFQGEIVSKGETYTVFACRDESGVSQYVYVPSNVYENDATPTEINELSQGLNIANRIFHSVFLFPSISLTGSWESHFSEKPTFKVTPRGFPRAEASVCDLEEKIDEIYAALFDKKRTSRNLQGLDSCDIKLLKSSYLELLERQITYYCSHRFELASSQRKVINIRNAVELVLREIQQFLSENDILLNSEIPNFLWNFLPDQMTVKQTPCAFCNQNVLERQEVLETPLFKVLCNYKPWAKTHFMIVSKRHISHFDQLNHNEYITLFQLAQAVSQAIKAHYPKEKVVCYLQDGIASGQTQPHFHLHVMLRPQKLELSIKILKELIGISSTLSNEEMESIRQEYGPIIESYLDS